MGKSRNNINILLAVALAMAVLAFFGHDWVLNITNMVEKRLFYPLFHANAIHATLNIFCTLQLAFYYRVNRLELLAAYLIAVTAPACLINNTLGFSGVIFALLGFYTMKVSRSWVIIAYVAIMCCTTAFFQHVNTLLHLYCYSVALLGYLIFFHKFSLNEKGNKKHIR